MSEVLSSVLQPPPVLQTTLTIGQGPSGAPGGTSAQYLAAVAVSGHRVLALDPDGRAVYASSADAQQALRIAGVSLNAAAAGDTVNVQVSGLVEHVGWAWTPDQPVYVGLTGDLVQAAPVGAVFVAVLGLALSPTRVFLDPQPVIYLA